MTASVTFGNINGHTQPAPHLSLHMEQKKAEPVAVTTPTSPLGTRPGIKHRGPSHDAEREEGGEGENTEGERYGEDEATPVPPLMWVHLHVYVASYN